MTKATDSDHLFTEPDASKLEELRSIARAKWPITYDCFNAIAHDDKVTCKKGYPVYAPLVSVLAGRSTSLCKDCPDFETEPVQYARKACDEAITQTRKKAKGGA